MNSKDLRAALIPNLVHAFLGKIDPEVRGILFRTNDNKIEVICYFNGEISEFNEEEISEVESEIISDFCTPYNETTVLFKLVRLDSPFLFPENKNTEFEWFYLRKEAQLA